MTDYIGKDVELIPMSKIAEQWAKQHAHVKDGKFIVRLLHWQAEKMIVQGKYRKRLVVDPYVTHSNYATWEPLKMIISGEIQQRLDKVWRELQENEAAKRPNISQIDLDEACIDKLEQLVNSLYRLEPRK